MTLGLLASLHAIAPHVEPPRVSPDALAGHLGATIALEARVVDVDPGRSHDRVVLAANGTRVLALVPRAITPPLGASVLAVGAPGAGRDGTVLWVESVRLLTVPAREPLDVAVALRDAAVLTDRGVALVGTWRDGALETDGHRLAVEGARIEEAPGPIVVWGLLAYEAERGRYVLRATGWEPWTPPT